MDKKYAQFILSKVNEHYNLVYQTFSRTRDMPWAEINSLFDCYIKENDCVLDLGCGNGRFYELVKNRVKYFGIDNSEKLIGLAKKRYPEADFKKADALNIPFSDNYFDVVFSISVIHHFPSQELREDFLKECKRVLKPGGVLIITVWDLNQKPKIKRLFYKNYFLKLIGKSKLDFNDALVDWHGISKCFVHLFKFSEFKNLIKRSGLKVIDSGIIRIKNKKSLSNFFIVAKKTITKTTKIAPKIAR